MGTVVQMSPSRVVMRRPAKTYRPEALRALVAVIEGEDQPRLFASPRAFYRPLHKQRGG